MILMNYFFSFIFIRFIIATPQINLLYTDWLNEAKNDNDATFQHDCLRFLASIESNSDDHQIIFYCLSESLSQVHIETDDSFPKFTFAELAEQNITSQDLYHWSAPIDIIEQYQFYLNRLSTTTTNDLLLSKEIYYNCTLPRFGSMCQYEFDYYNPSYSSLSEIVRDFYTFNPYQLENLTCYIHLKCYLNRYSSCLGWTEICDGKIDCLDGGYDEQYCWQLEINECQENEYRCGNGQCIPLSFYQDNSNAPDCIDGSDESIASGRDICYRYGQPSIGCEDIICKHTSWESSCRYHRIILLLGTMIYPSKSDSKSEECSSAFKCMLAGPDCNELCQPNTCLEIIKKSCPDIIYLPDVPILFGDIYFAFRKNDVEYLNDCPTEWLYLCYNQSHYDHHFSNSSKIFFDNHTCIHYNEFFIEYPLVCVPPWSLYLIYFNIILSLSNELKRYHLPFDYNSTICNRPNMYQCIHSRKCISIHRLMDSIYDCPYMDDENITIMNENNLLKQLEENYVNCSFSKKSIHKSSVLNNICDCPTNEIQWCEDENMFLNYVRKNISFQTICDGSIELAPVIIDEQNQTDETECQQWECNNIYTHCNGIWNCPNGIDEQNCFPYSTLNCSSDYFLCVSPSTNQFICLPLEKINDDTADCLGGTDEQTLCKGDHMPEVSYDFYCRNQNSTSCLSKFHLCNDAIECSDGDDEQFCEKNRTSVPFSGICTSADSNVMSNIETFICDYVDYRRKNEIVYFILDGMNKSIETSTERKTQNVVSLKSFDNPNTGFYCHRGLNLHVWLNNKENLTRPTCLCPPSFYGNLCQYENQRVSLALEFRALSDSWQTLFSIIIFLIDHSNDRIIHSYEQFSYLSFRDCRTKYNFNLLYSNRSKDLTKNYSIHIDIYEKIALIYRGSILLPIQFPFLPVQRLATIIHIPQSNNTIQICSVNPCIHGKCIKYSNTPENISFCQCESGWTGQYCDISYICNCSPDSLCVGLSSNNRSICLCPIHKFGSRCYLINSICQVNDNSTCLNAGQCIPNDDYRISTKNSFVCICSKGYNGNRCQYVDNKLLLTFEKNILLSQSIFIHFIEIDYKTTSVESTIRSTTFQTIPIKQNSVVIFWSQPFHLVFIELSNKIYYLSVIQNLYNRSSTMNRLIQSTDRCLNISELFNKTFVEWHLLRRIKYYHLPCQNLTLNLSCFYDNEHLCICYTYNQKRLANCFNFNHNMTFDCFGQSVCENNGQCLQDKPYCPRRSLCICPPCYYGTRCQFNTNSFGLSLDGILGYHIIPSIKLIHQPLIIKMSFTLTIVFILIGLINSILSLITFKNKIIREVGCGWYLLTSSIITLFIIILFGLKFFILLLTQMIVIQNRIFLKFQCHLIDFLLRIFLTMDQWLNACVAVERAITAGKGTHFNKRKSKEAAKYVISIILILIIGTSIHDPLYRRLIDEENDIDYIKRIWCIVSYPNSLEIYNTITNIFHFFTPFMMNLISVIYLILKQSRQQTRIHPTQSYTPHLRQQFQQHKHLLTAPILLIILALPRLIISLVSKCMKSTEDSWLFLIGYFISFSPSMLTFVVFILSSKFYKKEFCKSMIKYRTAFRRYWNLIFGR